MQYQKEFIFSRWHDCVKQFARDAGVLAPR